MRIDSCPECGNDLFLYDGVDYFCNECDLTFENAWIRNDILYMNKNDYEEMIKNTEIYNEDDDDE